MVSRQDRNQIADVPALSSAAYPLEELAECRIALSEAYGYQAATSEILKVIGRSPSDVQPVFDTIVERAVKLCEAAFGFVLRFDGKIISVAARCSLDQEGLLALRQVWQMAPNPRSLVGRAVLERRVVHVHDCYSSAVAAANSARWPSDIACRQSTNIRNSLRLGV